MEGISYAPASPGDLPAVRALLASCGMPADDLLPEHLGHFVLCRSGEQGAKGEPGDQGDQIVGTVGLELLGQTALLRSLAVAPALRGRRVGHELWARAREHARARGIRRLYLLTTTAEALFAGWGFRRVSRQDVPDVVKGTSEYSAVCPSTAAVMAMDLADVPGGAKSGPRVARPRPE